MAYEVLARKWRPKNFSELIGQESVRKTLTNALIQKRLYPVLLFTGPRGTGKTSSARILAKALRCPNAKDLIPCSQCKDCLLIQESRHLDVMEIDGASNNGVEAVRELRDTVSYLPSTGSWKIYIIDEVHMLSNSAFNALLKTLEEPPKHVLFIMATTESHKIPKTVLSRCQKLDFHLLSPNLIKAQLEDICKKEKISIEEGALWLLARQAGGSLRDAQSLLDQMVTFCGDKLTKTKITELLGLSDPQTLFDCLQALIHRKEREMIRLIQSLRSKGNEPKLFLQSLIEAVRNLLILKKNPDNQPQLVQASNQEIEEMKREIEHKSAEDLHLLFDMLLKGEKEMAFCYDSRLVLEVLLLRLCSAPRLESFIPLSGEAFEEEKDTGSKPPSANSELASEERAGDAGSKTPRADSGLSSEEGAGDAGSKTMLAKPGLSSEQRAGDAGSKTPSANSELASEEEVRDAESKTPRAKPGLSSEEGARDAGSKPSSAKPSLSAEKGGGDAGSKLPLADFSFSERLDFLDYLRKKDLILSGFVEQLCLNRKSDKHFQVIAPEKFSYLYNKITDPSYCKALRAYLKEFLNLKEDVTVDILSGNIQGPGLKEEKRQKEEEDLWKFANEDSFVKEVRNLFQAEIKKVEKKG